MIAVTLTD